jgi:hypothetical protein
MKEISSMDFPQHGEGFYFYGQALHTFYNYTLNLMASLSSGLRSSLRNRGPGVNSRQ